MTLSQSPAIRTSPRKRPSTHGTSKSQVLGRQSSAKTTQRLKKQANSDSSKPRQAPRCTKCPEHPLRSQCAHTKIGRGYLQQRALEQQVATFSNSTEPLPTTQPNQGSPPQNFSTRQTEAARTGYGALPLPTAVGGLHPILPTEPIEPRVDTPTQGIAATGGATPNVMASGATDPIPAGFFSPGPAQRGPFHAAPFVLNNVFQVNNSPISQSVMAIPRLPPQPSPRTYNRSSTPITPTPQRFQQTYDPVLMGESTPQATPQSLTSLTSSPPRASSPDSDMEDDTSSPAKSSHAGNKRSKPTAANPIHGVVPGAMRGSSQQYSIFRTHELPKAIVESKAASKKFCEGVNCIIRKCEALSAQTGCWLFIGAQHAAASGGAIHYASPRLRRDAVTEAEGMATQFLQLIKQVTESKRIDTLELQRNLDRTQERNNTLENHLQELQTKAREDMEKHQRDAELIREYSQRLGIVAPPN